MNFTAGVSTGNEGLYWLSEIKKMAPSVEVVMITAYGDIADETGSWKFLRKLPVPSTEWNLQIQKGTGNFLFYNYMI